jgi:hypothetical protein
VLNAKTHELTWQVEREQVTGLRLVEGVLLLESRGGNVSLGIPEEGRRAEVGRVLADMLAL